MLRYDVNNLHSYYDQLAEMDGDFRMIIDEWSYPPLWVRPNTFETLVLTILEQQVSLASAYAAYKKLKDRIRITPQNLLQLNDEALRACYLSRQKIIYTRILANAIVSKQINLRKFEMLPDELVREDLKKLKGIGNWTVDIYLIHALRRADIFPAGDLALINAVRMLKGKELTRESIIQMAEQWRPYRTMATMLFWHYYIRKKNIKLLH